MPPESRIVAGFERVVRDLYRRVETTLHPQHWDRYLEDCRSRDLVMPEGSEGTLVSLGTRVFGMMTEDGYLSDAQARIFNARARAYSPDRELKVRERIVFLFAQIPKRRPALRFTPINLHIQEHLYLSAKDISGSAFVVN